MKVLMRKRVGLPADPWSRLHLETADDRRVAGTVAAAVEARLMVSIVGPRGAGKTHSARMALNTAGARVVEPLRLTRERLHMGDIEWAIVRGLMPDERPRRSGEARSHQVRRVLGRAQQSAPIVLLIDDAHTLHHQTLRALKRLRELDWLGVSPLLGIVLLGQADRVGAIPEVGLRSDRVRLAGLTVDEAADALEDVLGTRIAPGAVNQLPHSDRARNWLDLIALVDDCLAEASARGEDRIEPECAHAVLHPGSQPAPDFETKPADGAIDGVLDGLDEAPAIRRAV
ncbi:MAG: ATP-binding protein [Holophagales bacterium]|nr:ATP-binding protein [Holophagales bacterium]MYB20840.1 ATP-binding protein [Holophagales bacterium]MYD23464.1 ATP-binding protein [Holophagales bacterium]MYH25479.1 ATP-binding protein [Holophagales bacterium]MYI34469.1 ATP-binding protein [Holophagales bacterium]